MAGPAIYMWNGLEISPYKEGFGEKYFLKPLKDGQKAILSVARDGPFVIDVPRTLGLAARQGLFLSTGGCDAD